MLVKAHDLSVPEPVVLCLYTTSSAPHCKRNNNRPKKKNKKWAKLLKRHNAIYVKS